MADEQWDVFPTLTECRKMNGNQVDAIEQVFAESMVLHHLPEVGIGGAYYPDIHFAWTAVAQYLEGLFLQYPKQFHLATQVQIPDFVQEDSAFVGQFETTDSIGRSVGKGSFLVSEHLALEQRLGDAPQVHLHKRLLGSWAVAVYGFCNQFFPRSAFSRNQYRSIGAGNPLDGIQYLHQGFALTDNVATVESVFLLLLFLLLFLVVQFEGGFDALHQGRIVPRLRDEVESTGLHSFDSQLDASPSRHQDNRRFRLEDFHLFQEGDAFIARSGEREVHVHQDQFGCYGADHGYRFLGGGNGLDIVLGTLQHKTE